MVTVEHDIDIASESIEVRCEGGELGDDGIIRFPSATASFNDSTKLIEFDEKVGFKEVQDRIVNELFSAFNSDDEGGTIYGKDFSAPRFLEPRTKRAEILEVIADNSPITSREVGAATDVNYASSELSALRDKGLVQPVSQKDGQYVYAITPLGLSEVIAHRNGTLRKPERQSGLNELFDNEEAEN
jgi:DNA-binding transcriptional ArsR family regulator